MSKKVAILQSNYIPWKGYFDMIASVDEFIIYDNVQFTKNDWRNRNKIKTPNGSEWLTIPVGKNINRQIKDVKVSNTIWQKKHWKSIESNYRKANCFDEISSWLKPLYFSEEYSSLSQVNLRFIEEVCRYLNINTIISKSSDYELIDGKVERLVNLCVQAGATDYISGPAAKDYIDEDVFEQNNIKLTWFDYLDYPEHSQLWGDFEHSVTILDLLFNCGNKSKHYMRFVN